MRAQMHGNGKLSWNEGEIRCIYKGQLFANVIQGSGILTKSSGDKYKGEFENGVFHGEGEYQWSDSKLKYKGQFRAGLIHGHGTLHNYNGIYEGEFRKGMMTGRGTMNFYNGDKYTG